MNAQASTMARPRPAQKAVIFVKGEREEVVRVSVESDAWLVECGPSCSNKRGRVESEVEWSEVASGGSADSCVAMLAQ